MARPGAFRTYIAVATLLLVVLGVQTLNRQWSGDWYLHAATVREFAAHPLHPHHPTIGTATADPEFSPYLLALGLMVKVTGMSVVVAFFIAALVNAVAFLAAFWLFVRRLATAPQAPTWALLFVLVLWGVNPWRFSGYLDLNSIGFGLPYPSMAAFALVLFALVALDEWCCRPRLRPAFVAGLLAAVAALTNPPLTVPAAIAAVAIVVWRWRRELTTYWWHLAIAGAMGAGLLAAWPLYPWYSLAGRSGDYDILNRLTYNAFLPRASLLLLVAAPVLGARGRRHHRDPLVLMFCGCLAVYVLGGLAGLETFSRTLPFAALGGQIAVADAIAAHGQTGDRRHRLAGIAIVVVGVIGCAAVLPRFVPRPLLPSSIGDRDEMQPVTSGFGFLAVVPLEDVVAIEAPFRRVEPAFGGKEIAPFFAAAFVDDASQRALDNDELFTTQDAARRVELLRRYRVSWMLVEPSYADDPSHAAVISLGQVVHRDRRLVLIRLP